MNDFEKLARGYRKTNCKPDKLYSILHTVLWLVGDTSNKTVVDVGCGDGFFTNAIASIWDNKVVGIDSSASQIELARKRGFLPNIEYVQGDMFESLPECDVINAPFVLNYARSLIELEKLLRNFYDSLKENGRLIGVVDLPDLKMDEKSMFEKKKYGAVKKIKELKDGVEIGIELFDQERAIVRLKSVYFSQDSVESVLKKVGFSEIQWHTPLVSDEGKNVFGEDFWRGYIDYCELGYFSAKKVEA